MSIYPTEKQRISNLQNMVKFLKANNEKLRGQVTEAEKLIDTAYHKLVPEHVKGSVEWFDEVRSYLERNKVQRL